MAFLQLELRLGQISWMSYSMQYFKWLAIRGALTSYQCIYGPFLPGKILAILLVSMQSSTRCKLTGEYYERRSHWHSVGCGEEEEVEGHRYGLDDRPESQSLSPRWPASPYIESTFIPTVPVDIIATRSGTYCSPQHEKNSWGQKSETHLTERSQ